MVNFDRTRLANLCREHGATRLRLFGRWSIRMPTRVGYKEYGAEIIRIEEIQIT